MAKILVEDLEDQTRVPFLRGILIRSLQDAGVTFDDAFNIASEVRNELADTPVITTRDLHTMVFDRLQALGKDAIADRYEKRNTPLTIQVEQRDGQLLPFSRLEYQHTLETIGLERQRNRYHCTATAATHGEQAHRENILAARCPPDIPLFTAVPRHGAGRCKPLAGMA